MEGNKTGALLACAASIGAVLGGADDRTADTLEAYGYHLGLAFQAVDDLLGIWGDPEATGKQTWSDLRQRKKSLPVVAALAAGGPASERLGELLAADAKSQRLRRTSPRRSSPPAPRSSRRRAAGSGPPRRPAGSTPSPSRRWTPWTCPDRVRAQLVGARGLRRRTKEMIAIDRNSLAVAGRCRGRPAPADGGPQHSRAALHEGEAMTATTDGSTGARAAPRSLGQRHRPTTTPVAAGGTEAAARRAVRRATDYLLARQDAAGLVEGRPGDQRHHGRRGPAAAPVPRHPGRDDHPRPPPASSAREQREDGTWATFHGGPRRPLHHRRGVRRAAAGRRRAGRAAHGARPPRGSASAGGIAAQPASSPGSGWRCSAGGSGTTCPSCRRSSSTSRSGSRSTSTTSAAGPGRPSCRSPSSPPSARYGPRRSRSTSCTPTRADPNPPKPLAPAGQLGRRLPARSTRRCTLLPQGRRRAGCAGPRMNARRPLDHRAAGERRLLGRHPAARPCTR